jgi:hypothetical protein
VAAPIPVMDAALAGAILTEMAKRGLAQVGKPLSVSVAGRTVDYGSAAEAFQAMEAFVRSQKALLELAATQQPFAIDSVSRG